MRPALNTSREHVLKLVNEQNIQSEKFPFNRVLHGKRKVWDVWSRLIPVFDTPPEGDMRIKFAMRQIEKRLGKKMFDPRPLSALDPEKDKGIIISYGKAKGALGQPRDTIKGHVSKHPDTTDWPKPITDDTGRFDCLLYLNLDSDDADATLSTAIHEFGHALGIAGDFIGYGDPEHEISELFWLVLEELYSAPL